MESEPLDRQLLGLIERFDELVQNASAVPLTNQVRIDRDEAYDILDQMRAVPYGESEQITNANDTDLVAERLDDFPPTDTSTRNSARGMWSEIKDRGLGLLGLPLLVVILPLVFILYLLGGPVRVLDWFVNLMRRPLGLGRLPIHKAYDDWLDRNFGDSL